MNLQHARILELCQQLKLERMGVDWAGLAQQAASREQSFADFLEQLLRTEVAARTERSRQSKAKVARTGSPLSQRNSNPSEHQRTLLASTATRPSWRRAERTGPCRRVSRP